MVSQTSLGLLVFAIGVILTLRALMKKDSGTKKFKSIRRLQLAIGFGIVAVGAVMILTAPETFKVFNHYVTKSQTSLR